MSIEKEQAKEKNGSSEEEIKPQTARNTGEDVSTDEDSLVAEHEHRDPEMEVSTDDERPTGEPDFSQKEKASAPAPKKARENLDEDALVEESAKPETPTLVMAEELTDEELEGEDQEEAVHSDEDEQDEHHAHHLELPDYAHFEPEKLVHESEKLLKNEPVQHLREHFDAIRKSLLKQLNEERQHKLEAFVEEGGDEIDFEYVQPLRESFRKIYSQYRQKRQKYYQELRDALDTNLRIKQDLIEQLKELVNKEESIGDTFKEFNAIQQEWRNTGPVPRSASGDLWRTYHHHVENFYEYIKINKELRDLDFRKNREVKEDLIEKAKSLLEREDVPEAFRELQTLHRKWKNTGPVERTMREPLWEQFSDITRQIHHRREEFYEDLRKKAAGRIDEKKKLIAEVEALPLENYQKHHQWQEAIKKVNALRTEFRKIGRIHHPEDDAVWDHFRQAMRQFNRTKNQYYKNLKKDHQENLAKKRALLEKAESLKDSEDWRETTQEMKRIQAEWKRVGHVPKSESEKIWKQFRTACNHFFERLTAHNQDRDKEFEGHFKEKEALLKKLREFEPRAEAQKEHLKSLKEIIAAWKKIGPVPRAKKKIEDEFNQVLDQKFKTMDLNRKEAQKIRFENKMESLGDGGLRPLHKERDNVIRQVEDTRRELHQLETNLSFFSSSNPKNPLIREVENNINKQREQLEMLEEKEKMLNIKIRQMQKEQAREQDANAPDED